MQVKFYSRPGEGDECDLGRFEYNGSADVRTSPEEWNAQEREGFAQMMDCFQEVLFIVDGKFAVSHSRTWL